MTDTITRIDGIKPLAPQPQATPPADASPEFRRILERLQQLAQPSASTQAPDADQLQDALRTADDHFADAMDLRRKLESAFKALQP